MNQHDQMRDKTAFLEARRQEALGTTTSWFYAGVKAAEDWQTLVAEPAPLVRLTEDDVATAWNLAHENTISHAQYDPERFDFNFANAIMDAMERVNGGQQ
ncbi:hypothetical protein [uncultured Limnobacter sp.]|uniref:hypothetical protein n=1 Tax=uncultured Limnobacter sp. TaxID=199681 RepID=UPI0030F68D34